MTDTRVDEIADIALSVIDHLRACGPMRHTAIYDTFAGEASFDEVSRILDELIRQQKITYEPVGGLYAAASRPRLDVDFSHLFEPPPGKIVVLADSTDEMKIGSLYVIRFGSATAGTICATYASFESPEGLGTVECFWRVGDRVLFGPNAGMSFTMDVAGSRRTFRVMGEKEILTRVKQSAQELAEKAVEVE